MASSPELEHLLQRGFRYALSLTHEESRAEDLVQDALLAILRRNAPRSIGYLMTTIRNRFIDTYRREQLVVMQPLEDVGEGALFFDEPDSAVDPEQIDNALAMLRPQEREALYLAAVESYTAQEIADLTGRPRGTVLSLIHRARYKLRDFLTDSRKEAQG